MDYLIYTKGLKWYTKPFKKKIANLIEQIFENEISVPNQELIEKGRLIELISIKAIMNELVPWVANI